jgi:hypothetical protein
LSEIPARPNEDTLLGLIKILTTLEAPLGTIDLIQLKTVATGIEELPVLPKFELGKDNLLNTEEFKDFLFFTWIQSWSFSR